MKILYKKKKFLKSGLLKNGFYGQDIVMAFSFAQKKAYQGGVTGTPGPPLATPLFSPLKWSKRTKLTILLNILRITMMRIA